MQQDEWQMGRLRDDLREAMKQWHKISVISSPIGYLTVVKTTQREGSLSIQQAAHTVISDALSRLESSNAEYASLLRWRYIDGETAYRVADRLVISESAFYGRQRSAIDALALLLYDMEVKATGAYDKSDNQIRKSIEIPPEFKQAFISLISYFSNVIEKKYPAIDVGVTIQQEGTLVTLIISTPDGEKERIEQELAEYSLVIQGVTSPEQYFHNPVDVLALKQKLEIVTMELRLHRESRELERNFYSQRIDNLERQVQWMGSLIDKSSSTNRDLIDTIKSLSDNSAANLEDSFQTILKILERGISVDDASEVAQALAKIKQRDRSVFSQLSELITVGAIQGTAGNILYKLLLDLSMKLP